MKSASENKNITLIRNWYEEVWNKKRSDLIDDFLSSDFVSHHEHITLKGAENWRKQIYEPYLRAVPDTHITIHNIVAQDNFAVVHWKGEGTFSDVLFDIPPTGKNIQVYGMLWSKILDGKMVENWNLGSINYFFQQLQSEVKQLRGLLPICGHCKKIRDDKGYWTQIESYIHEHSEAQFSHSICQECAEKYYPDMDLYGE